VSTNPYTDGSTSRVKHWHSLLCWLMLAFTGTTSSANTQSPMYWYVGPTSILTAYFTPTPRPDPGPPGQLFDTPVEACNSDAAREYLYSIYSGVFSPAWVYAGDCWVTCWSSGGCPLIKSPYGTVAYNNWTPAGGFAWGPRKCPPGWIVNGGWCVQPCPLGYELVSNVCVQPGGGPDIDAEARTCPATSLPVGINSGDKRLTEVDIPAPAGSHLEFARYYNSLPIRSRTVLSPRWMHTYSR